MIPLWSLVSYDTPSLSADGATLHAVDAAGVLHAYDAHTGAERWTARTNGRFTREEAFGDGVVALVVRGDAAPRRVCRVGADGRTRWCTDLDRTPVDLEVDGGLSVLTDSRDLRPLDPETGRALGDWLPGSELHLYYDLGEPHDTIFERAATVLGTFGGVTVTASRRGLEAWRSDGSAAWSSSSSPSGPAMEWGGFGAGLAFAHRRGPSVTLADGCFQVGDHFVSVDPKTGDRRWSRPVEGRPVVVDGHLVAVEASAVVGLDPGTGAERWRAVVDGVPAVVGHTGPIGALEAPSNVVWVDPAKGDVAGRTPIGVAGDLEVGGCGVLVGSGLDGWSCVRRDGTVAWSFPGGAGNVQVLGRFGARYPREGDTEVVDLVSGEVVGHLEGSVTAAAGDVWLVSRRGGGGVDVVGVPR